MDTVHERINELTRRINELARQQTSISNQLVALINELEALRLQVNATGITSANQPVQPAVKTVELNQVIEAPSRNPSSPLPVNETMQRSTSVQVARAGKTTFEEFIGKNVASKVGILVTIIGIFIGSKY